MWVGLCIYLRESLTRLSLWTAKLLGPSRNTRYSVSFVSSLHRSHHRRISSELLFASHRLQFTMLLQPLVYMLASSSSTYPTFAVTLFTRLSTIIADILTLIITWRSSLKTQSRTPLTTLLLRDGNVVSNTMSGVYIYLPSLRKGPYTLRAHVMQSPLCV